MKTINSCRDLPKKFVRWTLRLTESKEIRMPLIDGTKTSRKSLTCTGRKMQNTTRQEFLWKRRLRGGFQQTLKLTDFA